MAGMTLPTPLYGLYRAEIGFSELIVTVVFAVYAVGVISVLLALGDFSDRVGRRPVLLAAMGLSAGSALCFVFEGGLPLLFLGRLLSGFAAGLLSGAATATVMELAPEGRQSRAGFAATAANMGGLGCGPLLSGLLAQHAPSPLRLPYLVHLALLALSTLVILLLPETAGRAGPAWPPRPPGLKVPPQVRGVFTAASLAAFAGFALLGLFTAVAPSFLAQTLHESDLGVSGAVVFSVFLGSTIGQLLTDRLGIRRALPAGCLMLVLGLLMLAGSLWLQTLGLLVAGALCGGFGQGLGFRAGLTAVGRLAPADHRAGTISSFFVVAYTGISLPVVGVGAMAVWLGLRDAGLVFTGCVIALAVCVGLYVLRRPPATS
ncbi:MFS transporter [Streptomyces sp. TS71-3]|uniref:MFS transporter n=1 Tax=Streptomyces sp. TS71-3 TaxID=2733862 RepID=UPI001BB3DB19|nr:MFS transporter [Streptomyces sp. TS71-3]